MQLCLSHYQVTIRRIIMQKLEEYLKARKLEDEMNEFDMQKRQENLKLAVDYCFEYFYGYLDRPELVKHNEEKSIRVRNYREKLAFYDNDVRDWMVLLFKDYNIKIDSLTDRNIEDPTYLLYTEESEYNKLSYSLFARLNKRHPYLIDQTEVFKKFLHEHHDYINSLPENSLYVNDFYTDANSEKLNTWVAEVKKIWHISLPSFAVWYIEAFVKSPDYWDKKRPFLRDFEYDIDNSNDLLGIKELYAKTSKKPFIKGFKKELLVLLLMTYNHVWGNMSREVLVKPFSELGDADITKVLCKEDQEKVG